MGPKPAIPEEQQPFRIPNFNNGSIQNGGPPQYNSEFSAVVSNNYYNLPANTEPLFNHDNFNPNNNNNNSQEINEEISPIIQEQKLRTKKLRIFERLFCFCLGIGILLFLLFIIYLVPSLFISHVNTTISCTGGIFSSVNYPRSLKSYYSYSTGTYSSSGQITGELKEYQSVSCDITSMTTSNVLNGYIVFYYSYEPYYDDIFCATVNMNQTFPTSPCSSSQATQFTFPCDQSLSSPSTCENSALIYTQSPTTTTAYLYLSTTADASPIESSYIFDFDLVYTPDEEYVPVTSQWVFWTFLLAFAIVAIGTLAVFIKCCYLSKKAYL